MAWWIRPLLRLIAALVLPLLVPAVITGVLWALPGDPANIMCPGCSGTAALAQSWHLDQGPLHFYRWWIGNAFGGDLGTSWRVMQGQKIVSMLVDDGYLVNTVLLVVMAFIPVVFGMFASAKGWISSKLDVVWNGAGLTPSVILALFATAYVTITYGASSHDGWPAWLRLILGAGVLGLADGMFSGAVIGTRSVFAEETKQRYVQMAILRGEREFTNALPNVLPALIGQLRARILLMLSGVVIVEVVLDVVGIGSLLWSGTLKQDFGVVLAATFMFAVFSSVLLVLQALAEIALNIFIRYAPVEAS